MKKILSIWLLLLLCVAVNAQSSRRLRVYQQGGAVDTLMMTNGSTIAHSRLDLNGQQHPDYVSLIVTTSNLQHQYLIADLDSLVLPNGHTVVFRGSTVGLPLLQEGGGERPGAPFRTSFSGTFPGGDRVTFYWTENDHIRLETGQESRARELTGDKTGASFFFDDFDASSNTYNVYYPDRVVIIASVQNQNGVDNTDHIGPSGDCGIATATRDDTPLSEGDGGGYTFSLHHQAAYLCFLPRISNLPSVRVTQIDVTCSSAIAGTYQLTAGGLVNGENTSKTITLNLTPHPQRVHEDFFLTDATSTAQAANASYMVIAPQSESQTFTVNYHLVDTLSRFTTTYSQQLTSFKPVANKVYPVTCNIPESLFHDVDMGFDYVWSNTNLGSSVPNEPGDFYTWQATHDAMTDTWSMPTEDAKNELLNKCTWTWGSYNGTDGWMVEGTNNGNDDIGVPRIFLPLNGYKDGSTTQHAENGYYWLDGGNGDEAPVQTALVVSPTTQQKADMAATLAMNTRPVRSLAHSFNIPKSGTNYVDIRAHGPGYHIKVYDVGGLDGNYPNGNSGYLQITCAEGYKLNITGSVNTESCDVIYVYDVTDNGNIQRGSSSGTGSSINVTTQGNVMLLYFHSDGSIVSSGLDLTVTIQKTSLQYAVSIADVVGGTMTSDVSMANPEDTITLTATPAPGYVLEHIRVDTDGKVLTLYEDDPKLFQNPSSASRHYLMCDSVRVRDGNWYHDVSHFLMPYSDVVVTPYFVNADSTLEVIMAGNDTTFIEKKYIQRLIDNGMTQFRFYDYGGKNGSYNHNNVDGYMLVHAPVGYKMNVAGQTWTEGGCDPLYVHDGYTTAYQTLVQTGGSSSFNTTTHNNVAFMHFHTDGSSYGYAGYAATVTLQEDTQTQYNIPAYTTLDLTEEHMAYLLANGMTSMKVYDHAGPGANYANSLNGMLRFTLPEGYTMHVHGTLSTESCCDYLKIYDNNEEMQDIRSESTTVDYTTTSRVLGLFFHSDGSSVREGVDLTVEFIPPTEP